MNFCLNTTFTLESNKIKYSLAVLIEELHNMQWGFLKLLHVTRALIFNLTGPPTRTPFDPHNIPINISHRRLTHCGD